MSKRLDLSAEMEYLTKAWWNTLNLPRPDSLWSMSVELGGLKWGETSSTIGMQILEGRYINARSKW